MKTVFNIAVIAFWLFYVSETRITFIPFHIEMKSPKMAIGMVLMVIGFIIMDIDRLAKSHMEGYDEGVENMKQEIQKNYHLIKNETDAN